MYENNTYPDPFFPPPWSLPPTEKRARRSLFITGCIAGGGFLGYLVFGMGFSALLRPGAVLNRMYYGDPLCQYLIEILYSFFCVGMPFLFVFLGLRATEGDRGLSIPLGAARKPKYVPLLIVAGVGVCFVGSMASNYFAAYADAFGYGFTSYYEAMQPEALPAGVLGVVVLTLRSAVVPAMTEEFVFRGVLMQSLKKYGSAFAVASTAVLFGLMHANMTQAPFAIIAGLALGYCAAVTGSLWVSVAVHFCNNFVSVIITVVSAKAGEFAGRMTSAVIVYGGIALGVCAAVIYFLLAGRDTRPEKASVYAKNKAAAFFLAPTLLIAVGWLLWYTLNDIIPFASWVAGA